MATDARRNAGRERVQARSWSTTADATAAKNPPRLRKGETAAWPLLTSGRHGYPGICAPSVAGSPHARALDRRGPHPMPVRQSLRYAYQGR